MTVTHGFWNSLAGDRTYDAEEMSRLFTGIVEDGIFSNIGTNLFVVADGVTMNVLIGAGRAWFNETWTDNDAALAVAIPTAGVVYGRIDAVVLEVDKNEAARVNTFKVVSGIEATTPVKPTLESGPNIFQYPLCYVTVAQGVTVVDPVDVENTVGTAETPYIIGALQTVSIDDTLSQWYAEFDIWFEEMKDQLSVDAAGNLQIQIDELGDRENRLNKIVNGGMMIAQQADSASGITGSGYPAGGPDLYTMWMASCGEVSYSLEELTFDEQGFGTSMRVECTTALPTLLATSRLKISQNIEGQHIQDAKKGTLSAEKMTVRFWVQSNVAGFVGVMELNDSVNARIIGKEFTIVAADTPQLVELTFAADLTGQIPFDLLSDFTVGIYLAAGSDYTSGSLDSSWRPNVSADRAVGVSNLVAVVGNYIEVTGLGLYVGDTAPAFVHHSYSKYLSDVHIYLWIGQFVTDGGYKYGISGTLYEGSGGQFPKQMRVVPTAYILTAPTYSGCTDGGVTATKYGFKHRVDVASAGRYRVTNGLYMADARL